MQQCFHSYFPDAGLTSCCRNATRREPTFTNGGNIYAVGPPFYWWGCGDVGYPERADAAQEYLQRHASNSGESPSVVRDLITGIGQAIKIWTFRFPTAASYECRSVSFGDEIPIAGDGVAVPKSIQPYVQQMIDEASRAIDETPRIRKSRGFGCLSFANVADVRSKCIARVVLSFHRN